ncbi:hypothetical protein [Deefgea rivuli]|nr:hypothetical protein [Deefgea rivuli]
MNKSNKSHHVEWLDVRNKGAFFVADLLGFAGVIAHFGVGWLAIFYR